MSADTQLDKEIECRGNPFNSKNASSMFLARHEKEIVLCLLGLFLMFNILTAPFSPNPWLEEVAYSEPAVMLATRGHLTSHAWSNEDAPVWTGNAPLQQLLLAAVIKVVGFNYRTVRGINMVYYALLVFLMYQLVRRHELIQKMGNRLFLLLCCWEGLD